MREYLEQSERRFSEGRGWRHVLWVIVRPIIIAVVSVALVGATAFYGYRFVMQTFLWPVVREGGTPSNIVIEIPRGASTSAIAELLYKSSLIRNTAVFKVYVDFMGKGGKLRSGQYVLNDGMRLEEIVDRLAEGDGQKQQVTTFRVTEGTNIPDMAAALVEQGVLADSKRFLELCKTGADFTTYDFISQLPVDAENPRRFQLEGYLFPDTYEVYVDASEESIINKLLVRFFDIFTDEDMTRAQELGMTMDQIVTLASMIEKESKTDDFTRVSAVFHNRLQEDMLLQSDVTVKYVLNLTQLVVSDSDLAFDSKYNTHKYKGLPLGPVCNPGRAAIQAALYPDEETREEGYLYFCLQDPESGKLVFTKTLKEHQQEVEKYRQLWLAYDNANKGG